jgi:hypothetical protein
MTKIKRPEQKLISFCDHETELDQIQNEVDNGWQITSLYNNGRSFVGILEKKRTDIPSDHIYIPPRKKIKFSS